MKKIFYLIPLFLLFLIPKAYALPDCSLVSNATLYDVYSPTNISSINTFKEGGLLCSTIHGAYATSDSSAGLGWNINLSTLNNTNSYYQLDVYYFTTSDSGGTSIKESPFRNNTISIGTSNASNLWLNGVYNISDLNYNISYYYDTNYGRTYDVVSYIFKANTNFDKIFIPFSTSSLFNGYFDLVGISLTNTGQSSLTSTEINSLLANQSSQIQNDINNMGEDIKDSINNNFNSCRQSVNLFNKNNITLDKYVSSSNGNLGNLPSAFATDYIEISPNTKYYWNDITDRSNAGAFYNSNKEYISGISTRSFTTPANAKYVRLTGLQERLDVLQLNKGSSALSYEPFGEICQNKIDETNDKLDNVNDSINDLNSSINDSNSSGATDSAGSFFENFEDNDFGLSGIITAPLNTIKTITSNSCTPINLTIPFVDKNMSLPCMTDIYEEHFGSFLDIYHIITFGIIAYWVCVQIYAMVKGFKNPDKDEIEVMDL